MVVQHSLRKINDDGWVPTTTFCVLTAALAVALMKRPFRAGIPGIAVGVLYEQTVEWAAHGWLQSQLVDGFEFFRWRHGRHHKNPRAHHALQPISIWVPTVTALLSPALLGTRSSREDTRSLSLGIIAGFLSAHAVLNIEHYDFHAEKRIVPARIRRTAYYREVERIHLAHHAGSEARIYSVTNPWLDIVLEHVGATRALDMTYRRVGHWARHLDAVWPRLDGTWQEVQRASGATDIGDLALERC